MRDWGSTSDFYGDLERAKQGRSMSVSERKLEGQGNRDVVIKRLNANC